MIQIHNSLILFAMLSSLFSAFFLTGLLNRLFGVRSFKRMFLGICIMSLGAHLIMSQAEDYLFINLDINRRISMFLIWQTLVIISILLDKGKRN